jgi:hypothetical protein
VSGVVALRPRGAVGIQPSFRPSTLIFHRPGGAHATPRVGGGRSTSRRVGTVEHPPPPGGARIARGAAPFARLTAALAAAFPATPPYGGEFVAEPHLTLDHVETGASLGSLAAELTLPVEAKCAGVQLQWWANHDCRVLHEWSLG